MLDLRSRLDVWFDPEGRASFESVESGTGRFGPVSTRQGDDVNFGYRKGAVWLRFAVKPGKDAPADWLLEVAYPPLDRVSVFVRGRTAGSSCRKPGTCCRSGSARFLIAISCFRCTFPGHRVFRVSPRRVAGQYDDPGSSLAAGRAGGARSGGLRDARLLLRVAGRVARVQSPDLHLGARSAPSALRRHGSGHGDRPAFPERLRQPVAVARRNEVGERRARLGFRTVRVVRRALHAQISRYCAPHAVPRPASASRDGDLRAWKSRSACSSRIASSRSA